MGRNVFQNWDNYMDSTFKVSTAAQSGQINMSMMKTFLRTWIPSAVLIAALLLFIHYTNEKSSRNITERTEVNTVGTLKEVIAADLQSAVSDLMILASHQGLQGVLDGHASKLPGLSEDFLSFSLRKGLYDQIRFWTRKAWKWCGSTTTREPRSSSRRTASE